MGFNKERSEPVEGVHIPLGPPPVTLNKTRKVNDVLHVSGEGPVDAKIMFVATSVFEEEAAEFVKTNYGRKIKAHPRYLKGPAGTIFKDLADSCGVRMDECYYTSMCKWLMPKATRGKPKKDQIAYAMPLLLEEIKRAKPEIIVFLGKAVFDQFTDLKLKLKDIAGGWFFNEQLHCRMYPMDDIYKMVSKPELYEAFKLDLKEVASMVRVIRGHVIQKVLLNYITIHNSTELRTLTQKLKAENRTILAVDCEWHGNVYTDCKLRSLQIGWAPGEAAYIRFMDDDMNYAFDVSYKEAGGILSEWLDDPAVKYIGHHVSADLPPMHYWLGLKWYEKSYMDTEFAQQTADEFAQLKLERLAMAYTDLGRYDLELTLWKKEKGNNKKLTDKDGSSGYGRVPDKILIPYACKDVDVCIRAYPIILEDLERQGLTDYYFNTFNSFTTDVFTNFALVGLPVNLERLDLLREAYNFCRIKLEEQFRLEVAKEAMEMVLQACIEAKGVKGFEWLDNIMEAALEGNAAACLELFKTCFGTDRLLEMQPLCDHVMIAGGFNIRSVAQMRRWLFQVKKYEPLKSTANKDNGMPSMPWEKVQALPPGRRKMYSPSTDAQTLKILGAQNDDKLISMLLELNSVGNVCKAFLKPGDENADGDTIRENGLHSWVDHTNHVRPMFSTTETGRPRSWQPNCLNWPGWVNGKISDGMARVFDGLDEEEIPERLRCFIGKKVDSVRSVIEAETGWCMVESDYATAELRGQAFISGDEAMIKLFVEKDQCFCLPKKELEMDGDCVIRVAYPADGSIPVHNHKPELLMTWTEEGELKRTFTEDELLRDAEGNLVNYKHDLHWSLSERQHGLPRELLHNKRDRSAAKVGNFSSAYGATGETLERKIEEDTGSTPEPGTGDAILEALRDRQTVATEYLEYLEELPVSPGYYTAASGRIRRFYLHQENSGVSRRAKDGLASALGREARNFPFQESVAATAARASSWCLWFATRNGLQGRPMAVLYDALVTLCPEEERGLWAKAHELFMHLANGWEYKGRVLRYPIDTDLVQAWSKAPSKERKEELEDESYKPACGRIAELASRLDMLCKIYEGDEQLSLSFDPEALKDLLVIESA